MPEPSPAPARGTGLRGTINIRVNETVTLDNLYNIINNITALHGCRTCGLLGVDLILGGDPVELQQVGKLPGVSSASFDV
jgi:hypothetical protein